MLFESFSPYEHALETIVKTENQFSSPVSLIKVMLLLKNELFFATHTNFLRKMSDISVIWFLFMPVLK